MILTPEAERDLAEAKAYFEGLRSGLGDDYLQAIEEALKRIERTPEAYRVVHQGTRRVRTRRFSYSIYYRLEGEEIVVFAVLHSRSDPQRWRSRA